jgi:hypothetical protein
LRGADLRGANLAGMRLKDVDLSGADLSGANLSRVRIPFLSHLPGTHRCHSTQLLPPGSSQSELGQKDTPVSRSAAVPH